MRCPLDDDDDPRLPPLDSFLRAGDGAGPAAAGLADRGRAGARFGRGSTRSIGPSRCCCPTAPRARSPSPRSTACRTPLPSTCARSPASRRRPSGGADAQLPGLSDRGLRRAEGRRWCMVNTNPLYTAPEMEHQFADSGAVGLVVDRPLRRQGRAGAAEDIDSHRRGRHHRRPAAVAVAHRGARGAEVREEAGAADHASRTSPSTRALAAGPARLALGRRSAVYAAAPTTDRVGHTAVHRRHDRRQQGRGAHRGQPARQHRPVHRGVEARRASRARRR